MRGTGSSGLADVYLILVKHFLPTSSIININLAFFCHLLVIAIFNQPYTIFLQIIAGMPSKEQQRRRRKKELYAIKAGKGEQ